MEPGWRFVCQINVGGKNLLNYLLQDHRFLMLGFNKNINPAWVQQCVLRGSRVRSGPCF